MIYAKKNNTTSYVPPQFEVYDEDVNASYRII